MHNYIQLGDIEFKGGFYVDKDDKIYISLVHLNNVVTSFEETVSQTFINDVDKLAWARLTAYLYLISRELQRILNDLEKG